jgi:hypothetical protein
MIMRGVSERGIFGGLYDGRGWLAISGPDVGLQDRSKWRSEGGLHGIETLSIERYSHSSRPLELGPSVGSRSSS